MDTKAGSRAIGLRISNDLYWMLKQRCMELSIKKRKSISMRKAFEEAISDWIEAHQVTEQSDLMKFNHIEADKVIDET